MGQSKDRNTQSEGLAAALQGLDGSMKRVSDVLAPLDHGQKLKLYKLIRDGELTDAEPVARLLVKMLNGRRSEHARRVWTGWFDPLLVRDDGLMASKVRLPGCLHLTEVGGWWFALAARMEPLVSRIQALATEEGKRYPFNEVFASDMARGWAEQLRLASISILEKVRATPAEATRMLAEVAAYRDTLQVQQGATPAQMSIPRSEIDLILTTLEAAPAWYGQPNSVLAEVDLVQAMRQMAKASDASPAGILMYALSGMHRRDDPAAAATLYQAAGEPIVRDAILGRLLYAGERLREGLIDMLGGGVPNANPVRIGVAEARKRLERFLGWYDVILSLTLDHADRERSVVHYALRELLNTVEVDVIPVLSQRMMVMTIHTRPAPLTNMVVFIAEIARLLGRRGIASFARPWRQEIATQLNTVFRDVTSNAVAAAAPEDLLLLSQFAELGEAMGYPIDVTALDQGLITIVSMAIKSGQTCTAPESQLIERVVAIAVAERRRCKWWVTEEVRYLLELAEKAGRLPATPAT